MNYFRECHSSQSFKKPVIGSDNNSSSSSPPINVYDSFPCMTTDKTQGFPRIFGYPTECNVFAATSSPVSISACTIHWLYQCL